ncbi:MAG TPA: DNA alkylation repair protein, partial [Ferruginibacter sp.]|nr:DNA alkylation repair protein [Ferruginibacter sp.]
MSQQLKEIQQILKTNSNPAALAAHRKFVPGINAKIYGVRNPVMNDIAKKFKTGGFDLAEELWNAGAFEEKC